MIRVIATLPSATPPPAELGPANVPAGPPAGYGPLVHPPVGLGPFAQSLLGGTWGTRTTFEAEGRSYLARVETHRPYPAHIAGKPHHWHKGVTVYEAHLPPARADRTGLWGGLAFVLVGLGVGYTLRRLAR